MTKVKVKVLDQLHLTSVRASTIAKGEVVAVSAEEASALVKRGLVSRVAAAKPAAKKAEEPNNKAAPAPSNKAAGGKGARGKR